MSEDTKFHHAAMLLHRYAEARPTLQAPCVFCAYNGEGYYQAGTHDATCPWFRVGGAAEREQNLRYVIHAIAVEICQ